MSGFTHYGAAAIAAGTALPQTLYVKFHTGAPGPDATAFTAAETTRQAITLEEGPTSSREAVNDAEVTWTGLAANEDASHFSLWDASTGGNPWVVGALSPAVTLVAAGDATIGAGNIRLTVLADGD